LLCRKTQSRHKGCSFCSLLRACKRCSARKRRLVQDFIREAVDSARGLFAYLPALLGLPLPRGHCQTRPHRCSLSLKPHRLHHGANKLQPAGAREEYELLSTKIRVYEISRHGAGGVCERTCLVRLRIRGGTRPSCLLPVQMEPILSLVHCQWLCRYCCSIVLNCCPVWQGRARLSERGFRKSVPNKPSERGQAISFPGKPLPRHSNGQAS